jgi:hypothetical protein
LGVEIMANENVAPWFYFDLGPGIGFGGGGGGADVGFAWRLAAGTAFWGIRGRGGSSSSSEDTAAEEPAEEYAE